MRTRESWAATPFCTENPHGSSCSQRIPGNDHEGKAQPGPGVEGGVMVADIHLGSILKEFPKGKE